MLDMLDCVVKASHSSLPVYGGRWTGGKNKGHGKSIPGWAEDVEPIRQESIYWGDVWKKEGRPSNGWLHATYVKKKSQYHYAGFFHVFEKLGHFRSKTRPLTSIFETE